MPKARLAIIAALALALVGVAFAFLAIQPSHAVEVHYLNGAQVGESFTATFGISNHTWRARPILPLRLEIFEGGAWKEVKHGIGGFAELPGEAFKREFGLIDGQAISPTLTLIIKRLPQARLRLVVQVAPERVGWETLFIRAKLFLSARTRRAALMPFDTRFSEAAEVISREFTLQ